MSNKDNPRPSFFRRAQDAEGVDETRDTQRDNRGWDEDPGSEGSRYDRPGYDRPQREVRDNRPGRSDRDSRSPREGRPLREGRPAGRGDNRPPRGERTDFRRDENRQPEKEREAPANVIFGIHPVREAIDIGQEIEKIYIRRVGDDRESGSRTGSAFVSASNNTALESLRVLAAGNDIQIQEVPVEKLDKLTRRGNHQGVAAVTPSIEYADVNELIDKLSASDTPALIVALDGVTDVRNFGAIARSAECAGADAIVISAKNAAPVNSEAMKSSAGALSVIPVCRVGSLRNTLKQFQMAGMKLTAATEKSNDLLYEADFKGPTVIVMGGEDKGISPDILRICDHKTAIPILGKIESLNVSAAAAVMLFEAVRQRFDAE